MSLVQVLAAIGTSQETTPPPGAPDPPTNFNVADNSTCPSCSGSYSAELTWTLGDTDVQTKIYRGGLLVQTTSLNATSWTDTGGTLGILNGYTIHHYKDSLQSTGVSDSITPDPCLDDLSTPSSAGLSAVSSSQIDITPTGGGNDVAYYNIYEAGGALIQQITAGQTYNHTGLNAGTQYSYDIEAESTTGCKSSKLTSQSAYTNLATPAAPTAEDLGANSIRLTLPAYGTSADRYRIFYAGGAEIDTVTSPTLTYDVTGLDPGTSYQFEIRAEDQSGDAGNSEKSADSTAESTQNGTITISSVSQDKAQCPSASIDVTWSNGDNDTATIKIERKLPSESVYSDLVTGLAAGTTTYEDTTHDELAATGTTYYRVSFEGITGGTPDTGSTTVTCLPDEPFGSDVSYVNGTITVTWNDASSIPAETGFKIYRAPDSGGLPGTWTLEDTVGSGVESWEDNAPDNGDWHYSVSSYNSTGESDKNECISNPITVSGGA